MLQSKQPRVCDYEGSNYRTDFWEGKGRSYEDGVERQVMRPWLKKGGKRLIEIGAAYGRLANEYDAYEQVILLDYSFSQLQYARQQLGDSRFIYVAANAYQLPFKHGIVDGATMIRVIHHFENVPNVLGQIRNILANQGQFILEFANKNNLKAQLRHRMNKQAWNPNDLNPVEFVEMNFNFHPLYMQNALDRTGFITHDRVPVSWLRLGLFKRVLPLSMMLGVDSLLQKPKWLVSPSIFTKNSPKPDDSIPDNTDLTGNRIFACPITGSELVEDGNYLVNRDGLRWEIKDGIYIFKEPAS